MLARSLADCVPARVRRRGAAYAARGAVHIEEPDEASIFATVKGAASYGVDLDYDELVNTVYCSCTCPYFDDRVEPCKHIWATVVICDRDGWLGAARDHQADLLEARDPGYLDAPRMPGTAAKAAGGRPPSWRSAVDLVETGFHALTTAPDAWPAGREILYQLDIGAAMAREVLPVQLLYRQRKTDGDWGVPRPGAPPAEQLHRLPDATDRLLLSMIVGGTTSRYHHHLAYGWHMASALPQSFSVSTALEPVWMRLAAQSGRLVRRADGAAGLLPVTWDGDPPWRLTLDVQPAGKRGWQLAGRLERDGEQRVLDAVSAVTTGGLMLLGDRLASLDDPSLVPWVEALGSGAAIEIPEADAADFIERVAPISRAGMLSLPAGLRFEEVAGEPRPGVRFAAEVRGWRPSGLSQVSLFFDYGGIEVAREEPNPAVFARANAKLMHRDLDAEAEAEQHLRQLGVRDEARSGSSGPYGLVVPLSRVESLAAALVAEGWRVEVEGARIRTGGDFSLAVASGIDWFDLDATADFEGVAVALPVLLGAIEHGHQTVLLSDGSRGVLPAAWRERLAPLLGFGSQVDGKLRFAASQLALLDALLAAQPEIDVDAALARARKRLAGFSRVVPRKPPRSFRGSLRGYQQEGLGWLHFLRQLELGGCLADDMGLGKTVQALAMLAWLRSHRRARAEDPTTSLVVAPRSVMGNWSVEAARFVPRLRVLDHHGVGRAQDAASFAGYDVVVTTYGTMRRDIAWLSVHRFEYAILDESQAIKNAKTATAKAARLLRARHRLALSGTPVENHVGELLSLFDFLNPGLFGNRRLGVSRRRLERIRDPDDPALRLVARTVRPFMLRRLKEEVARELPAKLEETLVCELTTRQRREYDQLREYYRGNLLDRIEAHGLARSKIRVLEALLRLRQAACHPGLLDKSRRGEPSAKLELLLERLEELMTGDHKALVFSQFTSLLAIVRERLDARGVPYAYLDGRTRKRQQQVERFETDPACPLFLISLKAGGLGLNLTAASYVFLLDPWWNPAVEAQAVDRAHRIGQQRRVFAFRLIARDTVEEKVAELQRSKKALADALISGDRSMLRDLTREDLVRLLS